MSDRSTIDDFKRALTPVPGETGPQSGRDFFPSQPGVPSAAPAQVPGHNDRQIPRKDLP